MSKTGRTKKHWEDEEAQSGGLALVGKLIASRVIIQTIPRESIKQCWNVNAKLEIGFLENNTYTFHFGEKKEYDRILCDSVTPQIFILK